MSNYYVVGELNNTYGICDLSDASVEFLPLSALDGATNIIGYDDATKQVTIIPNVYIPYVNMLNAYPVFANLDSVSTEDISKEVNCNGVYNLVYDGTSTVIRVYCQLEEGKGYFIDNSPLNLDVNEGVLVKLGNGLCTVIPQEDFNKIISKIS